MFQTLKSAHTQKKKNYEINCKNNNKINLHQFQC